MLKKIRIAVSFSVFALLVLFFLLPHTDIRLSYIAKLQLIPLIMSLISGAGIIYAVFFLFSIIPALIAGRIYCSSVCPLGFIQDIFTALRRTASNSRFVYKKKIKWITPLIAAITFVSLVSGAGIFFFLFEPYSIAARIINAFVSFDTNVLYTAVLYLIVIACVSVMKGRLFCNTLCPAGSVLSMAAHFSFYKIDFDKKSCIACGRCEYVCKAECINVVNKEVDFERCIGCMNCIDVCPKNAINWTAKKSAEKKGRREFLEKSALAFGAAAVLPVLKSENGHPVMPPGALNISRFNRLCTACHTCVKACPQKVITISPAGYGILNPLRPMLDYEVSYCLYACNDCTKSCPTGALKFLDVREKKNTSIGKAELNKQICIGYNGGITCNVCVEHCPVKAVYAVKYKKNLAPEILKDICTGCGACEKSCPVRPVRAIRVKPLDIHEKIPDPAKAVRPGEYNLKFSEKKGINGDPFPF